MAAIFLTMNDFIYPFGRMTIFFFREQWQWLSSEEAKERNELDVAMGAPILLNIKGDRLI